MQITGQNKRWFQQVVWKNAQIGSPHFFEPELTHDGKKSVYR